MRRLLVPAALAAAMCACHSERMIYAGNFSFANYNYLVIARPEEPGRAFLYSMDVEVGNVLSQYGLRVLGDKEAEGLSDDQKKRTLVARGSMETVNEKRIALSVSFDDYVSGRALANMTATEKGNIYDEGNRTDAYRHLTDGLKSALAQEKGLVEVQAK